MTFLVKVSEECFHLERLALSTLAKVGVRSKFWQSLRNSIEPSQLICFLLHCSSLLNKCSWLSRFKILINKDLEMQRLAKTNDKKHLTANVLNLFLNGLHYDQKFRIQYFFARGFLGNKCHIFEVFSGSSSQWTSFLFKKCVYQQSFLCFSLFHEVQRGLTVLWET